MNTHDQIRHNLTNHPPTAPLAGPALDAITEIMISTGEALVSVLPGSREKSLALTKLEECSMWAKAAIVRNQDLLPVTPTDEA